MSLILASRSPRRRDLLARVGLTFTVRAAEIDETMDPALDPAAEVARISAKKAGAIAKDASPEDVILAADTIVVAAGRILGKPRSEDDARAMLRLLSGRTHQVMTGLTVRRGGEVHTLTEVTQVTFRPLTEAEIAAYVATGDPMDKAGSYGVQGAAGAFVAGLDGDFFNVMGLPLCAAVTLLRQAGVEVLGEKG